MALSLSLKIPAFNPTQLETIVAFRRQEETFRYIAGARPDERHWLGLGKSQITDPLLSYLCKTENEGGVDYYFNIPLTPFP